MRLLEFFLSLTWFSASIGSGILVLYVEWSYLRQSFLQMFNPFFHLKVIITILSMPLFWFLLAVILMGAMGLRALEKRKLAVASIWATVIVGLLISVTTFGKGILDFHSWSWSEAEKAELIHFTESLKHYKKAIDLMYQGPDVNVPTEFDISEADYHQIIVELRAALAESHKVSDEVLDRIDPNLRSHYRGELVKGIRLELEGIEAYSPVKQFAGQIGMDKWDDWIETKGNEINQTLKSAY